MLYNIFKILSISFPIMILVLAQFFISGEGQIATLGRCPRIGGIKDFNISRYEGTWYEVEKYFFIVEATASCVTVRYADNKDGTFGVEISQIEGLTRQKMVNPGTTWFRSRDGSGDMIFDIIITQSPLPFHFRYPYLVLDTDYDTYTVKYRCLQVGLVNFQNMWVLSRTKEFPPESREKVYSYLRRVGLSTQKLRKSNNNC